MRGFWRRSRGSCRHRRARIVLFNSLPTSHNGLRTMGSMMSSFQAATKYLRPTTTIGLACGILLSGCANQGTLVRKDYRELPFFYSLGVEGIYRFELRDRDGHIRDQMASAEVFANYEEGEHFNDLAAPPSRGRAPTGAEPMVIPARRPLEELGTHYRSAGIDRVEGRRIARSCRRTRSKSARAMKSAAKVARTKRVKEASREGRANAPGTTRGISVQG